MTDRPILRKKVDISIEDKIATAAIVSDDFIKNLYSIYQSDYIQNSMAKWVCDKALEFFSFYEGAPKHNIQAMFDIDREAMNPDDAKLISAFLTKISKKHEDGESMNTDMLLDKTIDYFKTREIQITSETALKYLGLGRVDLAEEAIHKSRKVQKPLSKWYNPFEPQHLIDVFDDRKQGILTMPGHLGEMLGPLKRSWLVGILGPFKRGKSWMLQEFALQSLTQRLKVAYMSFEMSEGDTNERLFRRITGLKDAGDESVLYPCFDCVSNQNGECAKPDRRNSIVLLDDEGNIPPFTNENPYRPCTACRNHRFNHDYIPATWFEAIEKQDWEYKNARKIVKSFGNMYGNNNLRVRIYPRFSASVSDMKHDLDVLESTEDFIPDVLIADHAGIIRPERSSDGVKGVDQVWKDLSGMTEERHILGVTAMQGRRDSIYKAQLDQTDLAEWIGILGHVNVLFGLNQTEQEKRFGLLRVAMLVHRHKKFDEKENCMILQQLDVAQPNLDTQRVRIF